MYKWARLLKHTVYVLYVQEVLPHFKYATIRAPVNV